MINISLNPNLIIISNELFKSWRESVVFRNYFSNGKLEKESISLSVSMNKIVDYGDIYILDTNNMKAIYYDYNIKDLDNRVSIAISKLENKDHVKVDMNSKILLELGDPKNIYHIKTN
jgi:hypothetical protein